MNWIPKHILTLSASYKFSLKKEGALSWFILSLINLPIPAPIQDVSGVCETLRKGGFCKLVELTRVGSVIERGYSV